MTFCIIKNGCSCCNNRTVVAGINDIPTTAPWMIQYFQGGYEEAKKFTFGSTTKINPLCPVCGKIKRNKIPIYQIYNTKSIGCTCSDGISYPEKFFMSVLDQLNVKYLYQLSKNDFPWVGKFYFDFYLIDYNCIVETHGMQHYTDVKWSSRSKTHDNDKNKKYLALCNNISHYIELDCRKSDKEFIRKSILESSLSDFLNFDKVNWEECSEYACGTIVKKVCDFWNSNNHDTNLTSTHFKLSKGTIGKYLKRGNDFGFCIYPYYSNRKVLVFKEDNLISAYQSSRYLETISEKEFGIFLGQTQIINNCNANKYGYNKTYKGYYFIFEPYYANFSKKIF